jgi:4-aminobutyrate aminotransferase-like enzyme
VIEDERLVERAARVGDRLRDGLRRLGKHDVVAVRGRGLITGVELASPGLARRVVDGLRADGILIGRTGRREHVLKIRPPLVFADEHADLLVGAVDAALPA